MRRLVPALLAVLFSSPAMATVGHLAIELQTSERFPGLLGPLESCILDRRSGPTLATTLRRDFPTEYPPMGTSLGLWGVTSQVASDNRANSIRQAMGESWGDVLLFKDAGSVSLELQLPVEGMPLSLLCTDIEGDGLEEVVVLSRAHPGNRGIVSILDGNGNTLGRTWTVETILGKSMAAADLNSDGFQDIVLALTGDGFLWDFNFLKNRVEVVNGSVLMRLAGATVPALSPPVMLWRAQMTDFLWDYDALAITDVDADGRPDVVAADFFGVIRAFRGEDGQQLWQAWHRYASKFAVLDDDQGRPRIAVGGTGYLALLDGTNGLELRRWELPDVPGGFPVIHSSLDGQTGLLAGPKGSALRADPRAAAPRWVESLDPEVRTWDIAVGDMIGDRSGQVLLSTLEGSRPFEDLGALVLLDLESGATIARVPLPRVAQQVLTEDFDGDGRAEGYASGLDGRLYRLTLV